jgi:hypothetical protein
VLSARHDEDREAGRQRYDRNHQPKHRDIDGEEPAASEPVGEPRPDIKSGDAEAQPDLEAAAESRNVERKFLDDERREKFKEHPVHAVEAPPEATS